MKLLPIIFKVIDQLNDKNYIFIGDFDDIRPSVNKSNNISFSSLGSDEKEMISK